MHACLLISEILKVIFAEVTQDTGSGIQPSCITLYHLALTCRAFQELALDALWEHIQSPYVLAMCLSRDVRSQPIIMNRNDIGKFNFGRTLHEMTSPWGVVSLMLDSFE